MPLVITICEQKNNKFEIHSKKLTFYNQCIYNEILDGKRKHFGGNRNISNAAASMVNTSGTDTFLFITEEF